MSMHAMYTLYCIYSIGNVSNSLQKQRVTCPPTVTAALDLNALLIAMLVILQKKCSLISISFSSPAYAYT